LFTLTYSVATEVIVNPYNDQTEYFEYRHEKKFEVTVTCAEGHTDCYHEENSHEISDNDENQTEIVYNESDHQESYGPQAYIDPFLQEIRKEQELNFLFSLKQSGYSTREAVQFLEYLKSTGLMYDPPDL
jgi:hypothetical protein